MSQPTPVEPPASRIGLAVVIVLVGAALVAGVFWYAGLSKSGTDSAATRTAAVARDGQHLVLGPTDAPVEVSVTEAFGCQACRDFELASRDFLYLDAAQRRVRVTYEVVGAEPPEALGFYRTVLAEDPAAARRLHVRLFDLLATDRPSVDELVKVALTAGVPRSLALAAGRSAQGDASGAADTDLPVVEVDGERVTDGRSVLDVARELQLRIARAG